jgi:AAA family ATP:ADP antiporter
MRKLLYRIFDIREEEGFIASLMFGFIFLITASLLIVKPIRTSLFLVKFSVAKLPHVYILVALFSAIIASFYSKFSKKARLNHLIIITLVISILCLLGFWFLLHFEYQGGWILYAFYIWVAIFGVITSAQFWILANYVFNAREAKRLFGFIGAGAISGGIFGGYLTNYLAQKLNTANLIFFCIGFLFICIILNNLVWRKTTHFSLRERVHRQKGSSRPESSESPIRLIFKSRHLAYLASIIGVSVVVANLVDFQFSAVASSIITDTDRLTAFFGFWISSLSIISLVIQLFITGRVMKFLGVATSLFFLPLGLFLGALAIFIAPVLWAAILIKVSDGSLKHSINKAGTELLALPIAHEIKNKTKSFIDVFIKNFSKGLGGVLLIILTAGLGFSVRYISMIIIILLAAWIWLIIRVKNEYVNSFRVAIEKRSIDIEQQTLDLQDASVFKNLLKTLESENERRILYVLRLLEDVKNNALIPYLKKLVRHPSNEVKSLVLRMAIPYEELNMTDEAVKLIKSEDKNVRIESLYYVCKRSDSVSSTLKTYLKHDDYRIHNASMLCAAREWRNNRDFRKEIDMKGLLDTMLTSLSKKKADREQRRFIKINAANIVGESNNPELYAYLHLLLNDESTDVIKAAVMNAGLTRSKEFIPTLISHLTTKHVRKYARESLAEYGEAIIDILGKNMDNPEIDKKQRSAIPGVLSLIGSQKSVNLLMKNLPQRDLLLRYQIIKALNKLRARFPLLKFEKQFIDARILDETEHYYRILTMLQRQKISLSIHEQSASASDDSSQSRKARELLILALQEKLDSNMERIFRLLGLKYPPKDMYNAFLGVKSRRSHHRANSVEFLDNILETNFKKILIPIIETTTSEILMAKTKELFGLEIPSEAECYHFLLVGDDHWLKICTLYLLAELSYDKSIDTIAELVNDTDHMVSEAAKYFFSKMGISN